MKRISYMKIKYLACIFCLTAMLAACTSAKVGSVNVAGTDGASETVGITSLEWRLVSVVSETGILTTQNAVKHTTMKIEADGKVHGNGGCNTYSGTVSVSGTGIKFGKIAVTQMACFDMKIETAFFAALDNVTSFVLESGTLKLKKDDTVLAIFSTFR
jgi:heat shock protein HslJ